MSVPCIYSGLVGCFYSDVFAGVIMGSDIKTILAVITVGMMVQGCETTSDIVSAANPMNWFEEDEVAEQKESEVPGQDEAYPKIGTVPERPADPVVKREYEELKSGLVSDRENAQYTDQVIRSQAIPDETLPTVQAAQLPVKVTSPGNPPVASNVKPAPENVGPLASSTGSAAGQATAPTVNAAKLPAQPKAQKAPKAQPLTQNSQFTQATQPPANTAQVAQASQQPTQNKADQLAAKLLANIYFSDGATGLTSSDRDVISQVIGIVRNNRAMVRIVGHSSALRTSASASAQLSNYKVSLDRANAVAQDMVRQGLPADLIQVDARGASEPVYTENTPSAQAYNRRVEIFILQ